jgi:hypothetical protein
VSIQPFANGSQYMDWQECNCCRCEKYTEDGSGCEIDAALGEASWSDGEVSDKIATRMGYPGAAMRYVWPCTEVVWTEAWKAEYRRLHPEREVPA